MVAVVQVGAAAMVYWEKFSKVSPVVIFYSALRGELSFENFFRGSSRRFLRCGYGVLEEILVVSSVLNFFSVFEVRGDSWGGAI